MGEQHRQAYTHLPEEIPTLSEKEEFVKKIKNKGGFCSIAHIDSTCLVPRQAEQTMVTSLAERWEERYNELEEYTKRHGHCRVPRESDSLGRWVAEQRMYYKKGRLLDFRVARLQEIGFEWGLRPCKKVAQQGGDSIRHGADVDSKRCSVKECSKHAEQEGVCADHRAENRYSRNGTKQAQQAGACGTHNDRKRAIACVSELEQHRQAYTHLPEEIPTLSEKEEFVKRIKNKGGFCSIAHIDSTCLVPRQAEQTMVTSLAERWEERYNELKEYAKKHGHCRVPRKFDSLGRWVADQRMYYKKGRLLDFRVACLQEIGFEWELRPCNKVAQQGGVSIKHGAAPCSPTVPS